MTKPKPTGRPPARPLRSAVSALRSQSYAAGRQSMAREVAHSILRELDGIDRQETARAVELSDARRALRNICEQLGCNDWKDTLYLPDVIERHLGRKLAERLGIDA